MAEILSEKIKVIVPFPYPRPGKSTNFYDVPVTFPAIFTVSAILLKQHSCDNIHQDGADSENGGKRWRHMYTPVRHKSLCSSLAQGNTGKVQSLFFSDDISAISGDMHWLGVSEKGEYGLSLRI